MYLNAWCIRGYLRSRVMDKPSTQHCTRELERVSRGKDDVGLIIFFTYRPRVSGCGVAGDEVYSVLLGGY